MKTLPCNPSPIYIKSALCTPAVVILRFSLRRFQPYAMPQTREQRQQQARAMVGATPDLSKCPICAATIDLKAFTDDSSRKEYRQSGMCQKCQDRIFTDPYANIRS